MILEIVLKYLNGECFVICGFYKFTLLASTEFNLTVRCCQTNENSHRIAGAALIYALNSWRHSVRAAVRMSLKLSRE